MDLDRLRSIEPDAALIEEITSWVIEVYPGERSKADYAATA